MKSYIIIYKYIIHKNTNKILFSIYKNNNANSKILHNSI